MICLHSTIKINLKYKSITFFDRFYSVLRNSDMPSIIQMIVDAKKAEADFEIVGGKWEQR